jgi:hypothetical protein
MNLLLHGNIFNNAAVLAMMSWLFPEMVNRWSLVIGRAAR